MNNFILYRCLKYKVRVSLYLFEKFTLIIGLEIKDIAVLISDVSFLRHLALQFRVNTMYIKVKYQLCICTCLLMHWSGSLQFEDNCNIYLWMYHRIRHFYCLQLNEIWSTVWPSWMTTRRTVQTWLLAISLFTSFTSLRWKLTAFFQALNAVCPAWRMERVTAIGLKERPSHSMFVSLMWNASIPKLSPCIYTNSV